MLPVRMGIGLSCWSCAETQGASDSKKKSALTERTVLRRRAGSASRNRYDTAKPLKGYGGIVLQPRAGRNITEVMAFADKNIGLFPGRSPYPFEPDPSNVLKWRES